MTVGKSRIRYRMLGVKGQHDKRRRVRLRYLRGRQGGIGDQPGAAEQA
jgi:hypothetical protein